MDSYSTYGQGTGLGDVMVDECALLTCLLRVPIEWNGWNLSASRRAPSWKQNGHRSPSSWLSLVWILGFCKLRADSARTVSDHGFAVIISTEVNVPEI